MLITRVTRCPTGSIKFQNQKYDSDEKLPEPQEKCTKSYKKKLSVISELLGSYAISKINNMFKVDYYDIDFLLWTQIFYNLLFKYDNAKGAIV